MKRLLLLITICISSVSFGQVPSYVPTNGLVGWWGFNGNANDESGNGNNGTVNGATLTTDRFGNTNSAYDFDGVNDEINANRTVLSFFSTSIWFNTTQNSTFTPFIDAFNSNWEIYLNNLRPTFTKWIALPGNYTEFISSTIVSQNQWNFLVCTFDGNSVKFYLNNVLISTFQNINISINTNGLFYLGASISGVSQFYDGRLDDIGIWDRALTQCEIQDLYNAQLNSGIGINAGTDQMVCEGTDVTLSGAGGSNYQWNNMVVDGLPFTPTGSQNYILTGEDSNGCLGIDTIHVEVLSNSTGSETVTECDNYTWNTNGQTYTQSGQYTTVLTNAQGCDSTVTLNLTITNSNTGSETVSECDSYTWNADGQTYTQSGQYTTILTNAQGCDSIVTLDLTITQPNTGSETVTECDSYTWNTNGQTYTQSGQYTEVLTNQNGCDSTVTLNLTITQPNTGSETVTECDSYTWNTNGQTYTQTGQYTEVLTNQNGCDSTVTLNLTINSSSSSTQTDTGLDSYTWSVNNQTYTQSGTYTAVIPNTSGCDSTITLDLTLQFTGLDENESSYVSVYPNPTYHSFILSTKDMIHMNYTLVDIQGKVVLKGIIESTEETVDISKLSKGQYNLVFEDESISPISIIKN